MRALFSHCQLRTKMSEIYKENISLSKAVCSLTGTKSLFGLRRPRLGLFIFLLHQPAVCEVSFQLTCQKVELNAVCVCMEKRLSVCSVNLESEMLCITSMWMDIRRYLFSSLTLLQKEDLGYHTEWPLRTQIYYRKRLGSQCYNPNRWVTVCLPKKMKDPLIH